MDIASVHAQIVPEIHERLGLLMGDPPVAEVSAALEELSLLFEGLGLCHLLESLDRAEMAENLCRSGHARRFFLDRARRQGNLRDRCLALGRTNAILDVLAAGDLALAADIARLSPLRWDADWEYEDDYCFFLFLHTLVLDLARIEAPRPDPGAVLNRFLSALEGGESARLEVCRALLDRDGEAFAEALRERLDEIAAEQDRERESSAVQEDFDVAFWPRSFISIEGLAMLRVAELLGMAVSGDFPRCPPAARLPLVARGFDDLCEAIAALPAQ